VDPIFNYHSRSESGILPFAQWTRDGRQAIVVMTPPHEDASIEVLLLPLGNKGPIRNFLVPDAKQLSLPPYPQVENALFMGSSEIIRLDLKSGEIETKDLTEGEGIHLLPGGEFIWYVVDEIERADREGKGTQFGELQPADLTLKPLFEFWDADEEKLGL